MYETISETVEAYDAMLNETNSLVYIGNSIYDPADILREVDPIAYRARDTFAPVGGAGRLIPFERGIHHAEEYLCHAQVYGSR